MNEKRVLLLSLVGGIAVGFLATLLYLSFR
jgi:xanthosine utilization system XapX-like protein